LLVDATLSLDISATDIRTELRERLGNGDGSTAAPRTIPEPVWRYILQHHLYHR
jgi:nicotinate-nucleotide adenylyltransferase